MAVVVGRDRELRAVESLLAADVPGERVLLLAGEAGIGKTTVWREAVQRADELGFRVLPAGASPAETRLAHATIGDLLGPCLDDVLPGLPGPQARALSIALLRTEAEGAPLDPATVAVGFHASLRALAQATPVLVAVDDVQWLDEPSAAALGFALRRLGEDDVRFVLAQRVEGDTAPPLGLDRYPAERLARVDVGPLSLGAIGALVTERLGASFSRPTMQRLHETANGNPFYALELGRALAKAGGQVEPGEPLPVPVQMEELLAVRLAALPPPTRAALLPVASVGELTLERVAAALQVDDPRSVLEPAVDAHVVELDHGRVRFTHPLLAAAIYGRADAQDRRDAHRVLAGTAPTLEERARHLALASDPPAHDVARVLDEAAQAALVRGSPVSAAELYEAAARFTPERETEDRARRVLAGADALFDAGDATRAAASIEAILGETAPGEKRVEAQFLLGKIVAEIGRRHEAMRLWAEALEATANPSAVAAIRSSMAVMSIYTGSSTEALGHAEQAVAAARMCTDDTARLADAYAARALAGVVSGDSAYRELLDEALALEPADDGRGSAWDWSPIHAAAACALHALDIDEIRLRFDALLAQGVESGNADLEQYGAYGLAQAELAAGNLGRAAELIDLVDELAAETGVLTFPGARLRAEIDALAGRSAEARARLDVVISESDAMGERRYTWQARAALGALDLAEGRAVDAAGELRAARMLAEEVGIRDPALVTSLVDEAEAAAEANLVDQAEEALAAARGLSQPEWGPPLLLRAGAIVAARRGRLVEAEASLARSLAAPSTLPLQQGRTLLALGSVQRRLRRRAAARASLEAALSEFERLGARLWAERAREELGRIAGRRAAPGELTGSERRIADLVAEGKTNKEVAAILVVSERTIESALTGVYRKLDVRSRTELARKLVSPVAPQ